MSEHVNTRREAWVEAADRLWGISNDARYWDGWRVNGDLWAMRYCASQLRRGVDLMPGPTPRSRLIDLLSEVAG
jgi:hypothetical protein